MFVREFHTRKSELLHLVHILPDGRIEFVDIKDPAWTSASESRIWNWLSRVILQALDHRKSHREYEEDIKQPSSCQCPVGFFEDWL